MCLGGATKEDVKKYDPKKHDEAIAKPFSERTSEDNFMLGLSESLEFGNAKYNHLPREGRLFYCRVLDNIEGPWRSPRDAHKDDPVFLSLMDLYYRVEEVRSVRPGALKTENANVSKLKKDFILKMMGYLVHRGAISFFDEQTYLTEERYDFLLKNLVDNSLERKMNFEKELVEKIPLRRGEKFSLWPEQA